jgi:hypothetical protein
VSSGRSLGTDQLFAAAAEIVIAEDRCSASLLAQRLGIDYARAAELVDELAAAGYVTAQGTTVLQGPRGDVRAQGKLKFVICDSCLNHDVPLDKVRFEVTMVPGAVSTHWCGMKVRWTGIPPNGMDVVHDPDHDKGIILIALLVSPAVIALLVAGPLAALVTLPLTFLVLQVLKAIFQGFQWWGDFFDYFSRRR